MLNIINNIKPFYEDCYRRINVREYSRIMKISPPTASKMLLKMNKQGLLKMEKERNFIFFYANKDSKNFIDLSRIYWRNKLYDLLDYINKELTSPTIVLFGSLSKAEVKEDSDIDIAIFSTKKDINMKKFEGILKRKIQVLWFESIYKIENKELANNILNGYILKGRLRL